MTPNGHWITTEWSFGLLCVIWTLCFFLSSWIPADKSVFWCLPGFRSHVVRMRRSNWTREPQTLVIKLLFYVVGLTEESTKLYNTQNLQLSAAFSMNQTQQHIQKRTIIQRFYCISLEHVYESNKQLRNLRSPIHNERAPPRPGTDDAKNAQRIRLYRQNGNGSVSIHIEDNTSVINHSLSNKTGPDVQGWNINYLVIVPIGTMSVIWTWHRVWFGQLIALRTMKHRSKSNR
jgi:hypothetical protein